MLRILLYAVPLIAVSWWLGPEKLMLTLRGVWKMFRRLASWIGTIPALVAGLHLWGNDT
ncbi:MAG: hypothetical protein IJP89_01925 [Synergistaceae bacterium]|nr:hypothetical protein [Synergistaceae bacterium]